VTGASAGPRVAPASVERTALKEWAVLVNAMGLGEIIAMVRKGGIREHRTGFEVRHDWFLLYPTLFHERAEELAERFHARLGVSAEAHERRDVIAIAYACEVAAVWRVTELPRLDAIAGEHGLTSAAVAARFHYRNRPEVHVIAVEVRRLVATVELPELRRYQGCVSWVELDQDVDVAGAVPIVAAGEFRRRLDVLREALGEPVTSG
jgi:hypothetical protein